jgi:hypothetical protein
VIKVQLEQLELQEIKGQLELLELQEIKDQLELLVPQVVLDLPDQPVLPEQLEQLD